MKKIILILLLAVVSNVTFASNSELFNLDLNKVNEEFSQLDAIAQKVKAEDLNYDSLLATNTLEVENLNLSSTPSLPAMASDGALGIPSFLWGCVLGPVGILITYLVTEDREETKKSLWGCLANGAAWIIFELVIVGAAASSASAAATY